MYVYSVCNTVWYRYGVHRSHVGLIWRVAVVYGAACVVCSDVWRCVGWGGVVWQVICGLRYTDTHIRAVFLLWRGVLGFC